MLLILLPVAFVAVLVGGVLAVRRSADESSRLWIICLTAAALVLIGAVSVTIVPFLGRWGTFADRHHVAPKIRPAWRTRFPGCVALSWSILGAGART